MIKLKSLLTEDVAEMNYVTKALQKVVDNFNNRGTSSFKANNFWMLKMTPNWKTAVDNKPEMPSGELTNQKFEWLFYLTNPQDSSATGGSRLTEPYFLCKFSIRREGAEKDYGNPIFFKQFAINNSSNFEGAYVQIVCEYDANSNTQPSWGDTSKAIETIRKTLIDLAKTSDSASAKKMTSTTTLLLSPSFIEDFKSVFNSIEIAPVTATGKKTWKGMKKV
jgi:hypothetical protein